jgi:hypothetical protein
MENTVAFEEEVKKQFLFVVTDYGLSNGSNIFLRKKETT